MRQRTTSGGRAPTALSAARFPPAVLHVLGVLDAAGHRSWLVGGAVRDVLLRRPRGADLDVATPARPERVVALFPKTVPTGIEHGTVTVLVERTPVEVTTFRGEGAYVDGRRPSTVTFLDELEGDLARRDFTVNAMAWDPLGQVFRDPFDGRGDLRRRLLRAVGDPVARFAEDGLRPLRAARFAAQLGFSLEARTARAIPGALSTVRRVAVERITEELAKLLRAKDPRRGLELLVRTGLLEAIAPEVLRAGPRSLAHAARVVSRTGSAPTVASGDLLPLRLAAWLHVVPGAAGPAQPAAAAEVLARFRLPSAVRDEALALVAAHRCLRAGPEPLPVSDAGIRRWLARVAPRRAEALVELARAEVASLGATAVARRRRTELGAFQRRMARVLAGRPPLDVGALALDGRAVMAALGVSGGPAVGMALRHLLDRVLEEPAMNTADRLTSELQRWWADRAGDATVPRPRPGLQPRTRRGPRPAR